MKGRRQQFSSGSPQVTLTNINKETIGDNKNCTLLPELTRSPWPNHGSSVPYDDPLSMTFWLFSMVCIKIITDTALLTHFNINYDAKGCSMSSGLRKQTSKHDIGFR